MIFLDKMKIKLNNFSKNKQLLLLDILDFLVDKGNMNIWACISSKKFFQSLLDLLKTKDVPEVQMKLLGLIQKWGLNFEDKRNILPNFYNVYNKLRSNNVQFPSDFESNYQIYISENENSNKYNNNDYEEKEKDFSDKEDNDDDNETFYYMDSLKDVLKVPNFEHKYRRLVNFLVKMHDNIEKANLLMDCKEYAGLKDIINTLREGNNTLIDTISGGRLKDEKLMEITLGTTEDINQTLGRDEDIKNGYKPNKFKSYFVLNNVIYIKNKNYNRNHRNRAKSTRQKKSIQRNTEKYKNYDMDISNNYDKNKYKEKMGKPKDANDIFDLFSASNPNNEPQYYQNNTTNNNFNNNNSNNNMNNFFSSQTNVRNNNNTQGYPQLRNNPMGNNMFNNNGNNNNNNSMNFNQGNNNNNNMNNYNTNYFPNNQRGQFNQNNNQQRPVMTNFDILEQKLNNLNLEQNQNNYNYNTNNQNMRFNQGFNNGNNSNNNNFNNGNNNNLMRMLDQLGPAPQNNSEQLVPYIGSFNNQNNNQNSNNYMNNFNTNPNNNFNNMGNNNNQFNNMNNNNQYNQNNGYNNNGNRNMFNSQVINRGNNNQMSFNNQINNQNQNMNRMNMSQNVFNNNANNNYQNNNQQMDFEEMQRQQRLKELDDLF